MKITKLHKHELMDRSYCLTSMFEDLIENHPAAPKVKTEVAAASQALHVLYQATGKLVFDEGKKK